MGVERGDYIDWFGDGSVLVVDLALACCALESEFAVPLEASLLAEPTAGSIVLAVVSGTLTDALSPLVKSKIEALAPDRVVSFGACACAGGPYWDAWSVTKGVDQLVPVDHWIAGCPPPPGALHEVVCAVREEIGQRASLQEESRD